MSLRESPLTVSLRIGSGTGAGEFRELAQCAEASGFDQIWTGNDLFKRSGLVPVALALDATSRILVGSSVLNPVSLHPAEIAAFAANLQDLSGGRYLLGLGAGSEVYLRWAGLQPAGPVARTRQGLVAIRALLEGDLPAHAPAAGGGWDEAARLVGPPAQTRIYVGAMGPRMLAMAGQLADGVLALCLPPTHYAWVRERVSAGGSATGIEGERRFDLACCVWLSLDADRGTAERMLAEKIALYSGSLSKDALESAGYDPADFDQMQRHVTAGDVDKAVRLVSPEMLRIGIAGGRTEVIDQCLQLLDSGVSHLSFGHPHGADRRAVVRTLGDEILPVLRRHAAAA